MRKVELHWPAIRKVPRVGKREHLPPMTTPVLPLASQAAVKSILIHCRVGKRVLEEFWEYGGERSGWVLPCSRAGEQVKPY